MIQSIINHRNKLLIFALLFGLLTIFLAGCSSLGGDKGNPLPTPLPAQDVGGEAGSAAAKTPEETWQRYRDDIIAEQVRQRGSLVQLRQRYEDPSITQQSLGSIVTDIDLVDGGDRTEWNISGNSASSFVEFDVRLTYADGDTETKTCRFNVGLQHNEADDVWYVLNPAPLQVFADCT